MFSAQEDSPLCTCPSTDVTLAYRLFSEGSATPVLFIHGMAYFSYDWVDFGKRLCADRPGCAMDMRGFGDSSHSEASDYSVPTMAQDIAHLVDHLRWGKAIIVAHSMGARSATWFSARYPERVERLVLLDWSPETAPVGAQRIAKSIAATPDIFPTLEDARRYFGADPDVPERRIRFAHYTRPVDGGVAIKRDRYFREQYRRQLVTGEAPPLGVDLWQTLREVAAPVLVLRAARSDLFAADTVQKVLQCNPRIAVREVEAGHHIAGDNPDAALAAISGFIH